MNITKPSATESPGISDASSPATVPGLSASLLCSLALICRALFLDHPELRLTPLLAVRLALAVLLAAWECVRFAASRGRASGPFTTRLFGSGRSVALLSWSALAAAVDVIDGSGPLVFVAGSVYATALGWNRMGRLLSLDLSGAILVSLASLGAWRLRGLPFKPESVLLAAAAAGVSLALVRAMRSFVVPDRERMRSLERENRQLWDLSFKDSLTGLYNRRFAQETGRQALARAQRYGEQLHVFMIDIDHFKDVNDQLSHAVGDIVLKGVSQSIQSCLRTSDTVSRYGGEEFLAFVVRAEADLAQFIANRIREAVAARRYPEVPWTITVSIGVASAQASDDLESLVDRADKYLYYSKRGGRNRVSGF